MAQKKNVPGSTSDRYGLVMREQNFKNVWSPAALLLRMAARDYFKMRSKPKVSQFFFLQDLDTDFATPSPAPVLSSIGG